MKIFVWFGFVLGALSAAGEVILTKPGKKASIECGVNTYSNYLEWHRGNDLIIHVPMKGWPRNVSASPSAELQLGSEVTLSCEVKSLNPGSAVQWKKPDGSPFLESQTVQLKVSRSDAGTWYCTFSHNGKMYSEGLEIKVQESAPETASSSPPKSSADIHKTACPNCGIASPPPDAALLLGLSWWVWVAVGVGGLVVVLLMVFAIVLCRRIKRRKRIIQKMKNGRQPLKPKKYCQCDRPAAAAKPQQGRRREKPSAPPLQPLLIQ